MKYADICKLYIHFVWAEKKIEFYSYSNKMKKNVDEILKEKKMFDLKLIKALNQYLFLQRM